MLGIAFVLIVFSEIGSHRINDSEDITHFETLGFCGIQHNLSLAAVGPNKQKQRGPNSDLLDEMTTHAAIPNNLTLLQSRLSYWTDTNPKSNICPLSGNLTTPFHPPKQS